MIVGVFVDFHKLKLTETEMHVLFECTLYEEERERWRGAVGWYG